MSPIPISTFRSASGPAHLQPAGSVPAAGDPTQGPAPPSVWALGLFCQPVSPTRALNPNVGAQRSDQTSSPHHCRGAGVLGMMKSSPKEEAKDVNEPMKSRMTAVTTVAIKHRDLTAPEIHLGHLSAAPAHHTCTREPCTRVQTRARTQAQRAAQQGRIGNPGRWFQQCPWPQDGEGGSQASFHSLHPSRSLPLSDSTLYLHSTHSSPASF